MSKGDVEAIGAHCQLEYCHVLDLLPFECSVCRGMFCLDHRSRIAHKCKIPEARSQMTMQTMGSAVSDTVSIKSPEKQCYHVSCKTVINTSRMPENYCTACKRSYCLSHRFPEDHDCKNVCAQVARLPMGKEALSALQAIKIWGANKRRENEERRKSKMASKFFGLGKPSTSSIAIAETNALKREARGDAKVPQAKRVYLYVEASADATKAKFPTGKFFYDKDMTVGRVLDTAAKALAVQNVNNHGGGEKEKLRVFHVENGRLLKFHEKIGDACMTGNMIVLLRGVGDDEANLIDL